MVSFLIGCLVDAIPLDAILGVVTVCFIVLFVVVVGCAVDVVIGCLVVVILVVGFVVVVVIVVDCFSEE